MSENDASAVQPVTGPPVTQDIHGVDHASDLDKLKFYREEIKAEFALLSNRVSAHISSQSFLIIAYASAMGNQHPRWGEEFRLLFSIALVILGITTSLQAWLGIRAASDTIALWRSKQNDLLEHNPALEDYRVQRPVVTRRNGKLVDITHERSLVFSRWTPLTFTIAWLAFGSLSVALRLAG
jgi:hypothetical protein